MRESDQILVEERAVEERPVLRTDVGFRNETPDPFRSPFARILAVCAAMLGISAVLTVAGCQRGPMLRVINETGETVDSLAVLTSGGSVRINRLAPGQTAEHRLRAIGESGLEIVRAHGSEADTLPLNVYFEAGYGGSVTLHLLGNGQVELADSIEIGLLPW